MTDKNRYPKVDQALAELNHTELSRLGKKGAASRKRRKKKVNPFRIKFLLRGAAEAEREANLDVCPIPD